MIQIYWGNVLWMYYTAVNERCMVGSWLLLLEKLIRVRLKYDLTLF